MLTVHQAAEKEQEQEQENEYDYEKKQERNGFVATKVAKYGFGVKLLKRTSFEVRVGFSEGMLERKRYEGKKCEKKQLRKKLEKLQGERECERERK
jgi:hypothetical protein